MKKHIPNFITLLNVFCGCVATVFAVENNIALAALFVALGIFFDFFDGLTARLLKVQSELGLQLDSLADMITSGLVPGVIMFQLLRTSQTQGWQVVEYSIESQDYTSLSSLLPFFGFIITMASAYRLAKFNIDQNQTTSFIGVPTPANTLLIASLPLILLYQHNSLANAIILNQWFLIVLTLLSAFLLNCSIPLFALKFKTWSFSENKFRYIFLITCLALLMTLHFVAIPFILLLYILSSFLQRNVDSN